MAKKHHVVSIQGMHCQHCMMKVNQALSSIPGVSNIHVDLMEEQATLDSESALDPKIVKEKISAVGFTFVSLT
jgi:copper chaperone CopZ